MIYNIYNICFIAIGLGVLVLKLLAIYLTLKVRRRLNNIQILILIGINLTQVQIIATINLNIFPGLFSHKNDEATILDIYIAIISLSLHEIAIFIFTANRFCEVYLNLRYNQVCTYRRLKATVGLVSVALTTVFISAVLSQKSYVYIHKSFYAYIFPITDAFLLVFIIITNGYIGYHLYRHQQFRRRTLPMRLNDCPTRNQITRGSLVSNSKLALKSYLVPCLIVINFTFFFLIPGLVNGLILMGKQVSNPNRIFLVILIYTGFAIDFLIYTFLSPPIRRELVDIFKRRFRFTNDISINIE